MSENQGNPNFAINSTKIPIKPKSNISAMIAHYSSIFVTKKAAFQYFCKKCSI